MWYCQHCKYAFKWASTLNYHLSEFHNDQTEPMVVPPMYDDTSKKHGNRKRVVANVA